METNIYIVLFEIKSVATIGPHSGRIEILNILAIS